jgi:hypothetical protein
MIVYNLLCENAHRFEGWFGSAEAFDHQHLAGQLSCPVCGSSSVQRQPSAPHVHTRAAEAPAADQALTMQQIRAHLVDYLLKNSEDVGERFSEEARAIFYEEAPERPIRGRATVAEARELHEEGIEVFALPMPPAPKDKLH